MSTTILMKASHMATVLVIDDEAPIVELLVDIIEDEGHTVLQASNGVEGLTLAREKQPDLIISDIMMPLLNGYEFLRALRADTSIAHIQVILMSAALPVGKAGNGSSDDFRADGYLQKPFELTTIEDILDGLN
ncbi:MAG: response regulator [Chloroflexaceae bacterium]